MAVLQCPKCLKEMSYSEDIVGQSTACPHCQNVTVVPAPLPVLEYESHLPAAKTTAMGETSLILGLFSLPSLCWCPAVGIPITITGLVLGFVALHTAGRQAAIAGIVLNTIGLAGSSFATVEMASRFN